MNDTETVRTVGGTHERSFNKLKLTEKHGKREIDKGLRSAEKILDRIYEKGYAQFYPREVSPEKELVRSNTSRLSRSRNGGKRGVGKTTFGKSVSTTETSVPLRGNQTTRSAHRSIVQVNTLVQDFDEDGKKRKKKIWTNLRGLDKKKPPVIEVQAENLSNLDNFIESLQWGSQTGDDSLKGSLVESESSIPLGLTPRLTKTKSQVIYEKYRRVSRVCDKRLKANQRAASGSKTERNLGGSILKDSQKFLRWAITDDKPLFEPHNLRSLSNAQLLADRQAEMRHKLSYQRSQPSGSTHSGSSDENSEIQVENHEIKLAALEKKKRANHLAIDIDSLSKSNFFLTEPMPYSAKSSPKKHLKIQKSGRTLEISRTRKPSTDAMMPKTTTNAQGSSSLSTNLSEPQTFRIRSSKVNQAFSHYSSHNFPSTPKLQYVQKMAQLITAESPITAKVRSSHDKTLESVKRGKPATGGLAVALAEGGFRGKRSLENLNEVIGNEMVLDNVRGLQSDNRVWKKGLDSVTWRIREAVEELTERSKGLDRAELSDSYVREATENFMNNKRGFVYGKSGLGCFYTTDKETKKQYYETLRKSTS